MVLAVTLYSAPCWRCAVGAPTRRSRCCARASHASGISRTTLHSSRAGASRDRGGAERRLCVGGTDSRSPGRRHRTHGRDSRRQAGPGPSRTGGTRGARPSRPGPVGPRVCSGPSGLNRRVAEGIDSVLDTDTDARAAETRPPSCEPARVLLPSARNIRTRLVIRSDMWARCSDPQCRPHVTDNVSPGLVWRM